VLQVVDLADDRLALRKMPRTHAIKSLRMMSAPPRPARLRGARRRETRAAACPARLGVARHGR